MADLTEEQRAQVEKDRAAAQAETNIGKQVADEYSFKMKHSGAKIGTHPDEPGDNSVEPHDDFKLKEPDA